MKPSTLYRKLVDSHTVAELDEQNVHSPGQAPRDSGPGIGPAGEQPEAQLCPT